MNRRLFRLGLIALVALGTAGTTFARTPLSMNLFNNSPHDIRVVNPATNKVWTTVEPGKSFRFVYTNGVLIYTLDGRQLRYEAVEPPPQMIQGGLLSQTCKAQFNGDTTIWILPPATHFPAIRLPAQPAGFPLRPR